MTTAGRSRTQVLRAMTEVEFQDAVVQFARLRKWEVNHHRTTMAGRNGGWVTATTMRGWPDLTFLRPPDMFFAELKTERGQLTVDQRNVIELLRKCGQTVYLWRPRDWADLERILR